MKHIETKTIRENLYGAIYEIEVTKNEVKKAIEAAYDCGIIDKDEWERQDMLTKMMEILLDMTTYLEEEFNKEYKININPTYYE